jgi:hypothetical protein
MMPRGQEIRLPKQQTLLRACSAQANRPATLMAAGRFCLQARVGQLAGMKPMAASQLPLGPPLTM